MPTPAPLACAAALLAATLAALPAPAAAQGRQCGPRDAVLATLAGTFGETRRGMGLAGDATAVVELFASAETGSWTVTLTMPNGLTCLLAAGAGWEMLAEELPARGDPT